MAVTSENDWPVRGEYVNHVLSATHSQRYSVMRGQRLTTALYLYVCMQPYAKSLFAHLKPKNATNLKEKLKCCKVFTQSWCINKNKMHQSTNETDFLKQIILYMKHVTYLSPKFLLRQRDQKRQQICVDCRSINYIISLRLLLLQ